VLRAGVQQLGKRPLELVERAAGSWADDLLNCLNTAGRLPAAGQTGD
jgi:hypothetical protein